MNTSSISIGENSSRYSIFYIAGFYAVQAFFYAANYWSLGFTFSCKGIVSMVLILAPFAGWLWLRYMGRLFAITGNWFGGYATDADLRVSLAWAKIPVLLFVPIWIYFIVQDSDKVFILGAKDPSPLLINGASLLLGACSQLLRIQAIRKIQGFSFARAMANVLVCLCISAIASFLLFLFVRFICISI